MLISLVLYERYFQHPRFINFRPDHDALNVFQQVFGDTQGPEKSGAGSTKSGEETPDGTNGGSPSKNGKGGGGKSPNCFFRDKVDRHKQLRQLLNVVRNNKDTGLNLTLDAILGTEIIQLKDKQDSQPSPRLRPIVSEESNFEPDPINYSWEGVRQEWEDDGTEKRLKLLAFMEI